MNENLHSFLHLLFLSTVALFPVINPVGSAFIVSPYMDGLDKAAKRTAVKKIVLYVFILCSIVLFAGHWILELFGISIPVIQLAGGIMICKIGWDSLTTGSGESVEDAVKENTASGTGLDNLRNQLFYPLTFPITAGAGVISVLFTLGAHSENASTVSYLINTAAILTAITIMCILIYVFYLKTKTILQYLGSHTETYINRIMAFLIFCVGLQIAVTGIKVLELFK
ncbi:MAG: MarC family protein [Bacteroidetes bacterium]|jgi:multiple antibiotic resistance protein|nr:MarC family protein [Bacteroidota bacterium]